MRHLYSISIISAIVCLALATGCSKPADTSKVGTGLAVDNTIDRALTTLRADTPNQADCKKVMAELLKTFDSFKSKI